MRAKTRRRRSPRQVQVHHHDEAVAARRLPGREIARNPLDLHAPLRRQTTRLVEGDGGEIHANHLPPPFGEPDGVAALAARHVEGDPRCEVADLLSEEAVGSRAPHELAPAVPFVPGIRIHHP